MKYDLTGYNKGYKYTVVYPNDHRISYIDTYFSNGLTGTDRIMEKKKRFNLQAPPVYDRKVTNIFFSIIIFSIIFFFP